MKYNSNNKPIACMMTNSTCYKGTSMGTPVGVLWHCTGANNKTLKRYVQPSKDDPNYNYLIKLIGRNLYGNDFNHIERQAGLNAWIDQLANKSIASVQTMPWNYRPWGCGSGKYGSCNGDPNVRLVEDRKFWIQFEICEDGLTDKSYFDQVFREACELTAYLCKEFNIDPLGKVSYSGISVPTILCHYDSYTLGLGSNHYDIYNWFNNFGKTMKDAREEVSAILKKEENIVAEEMYRIRLSWDNKDSQVGAYRVLENAIANCPVGYRVYDSKGNEVYYNDGKISSDDDQESMKVFNENMDAWLKDRFDEEPSDWSEEARKWAEENKIVVGNSSGYVSYKSFVTKEEVVVMLKRFYDLFNLNS